MTYRRTAGAIAAALIAMSCVGEAAAASVASENRQFNAIVARAVRNISNDFVNQMTSSERRTWNACVQEIFANVPQGRKRYVLAGGSRSEQEERLRTVSQENHAAVQQQITREC